MKKVFILIIFLFIVVLLAVTNPQKTDYVNWAIERETNQSQDILSKGVINLLGKPLIEQFTVKEDYVLFSIYTTNFDGNGIKTIGILKNFINLDSQGNTTSLLTAIVIIALFVIAACLFLYLILSKNNEA